MDGGYVFSDFIIQKIGKSNNLVKDVQNDHVKYIEVNSLFDIKKNRLTLLDREQDIQKYLHTSSPRDVNAILVELFSNRGEGLFVPPILSLKNIELLSFIINNYKNCVMMLKRWIVIILICSMLILIWLTKYHSLFLK